MKGVCQPLYGKHRTKDQPPVVRKSGDLKTQSGPVCENIDEESEHFRTEKAYLKKRHALIWKENRQKPIQRSGNRRIQKSAQVVDTVSC